MISLCLRQNEHRGESLRGARSVCEQPLQDDVVGLYAAVSSTNTRFPQRHDIGRISTALVMVTILIYVCYVTYVVPRPQWGYFVI